MVVPSIHMAMIVWNSLGQCYVKVVYSVLSLYVGTLSFTAFNQAACWDLHEPLNSVIVLETHVQNIQIFINIHKHNFFLQSMTLYLSVTTGTKLNEVLLEATI